MDREAIQSLDESLIDQNNLDGIEIPTEIMEELLELKRDFPEVPIELLTSIAKSGIKLGYLIGIHGGNNGP